MKVICVLPVTPLLLPTTKTDGTSHWGQRFDEILLKRKLNKEIMSEQKWANMF